MYAMEHIGFIFSLEGFMLDRALNIKDEKLFNYIMFCVKENLSVGNANSLKKYHESEAKLCQM